MAEHMYRLTYTVEAPPEGLTAAAAKARGIGAADALVVVSIVRGEDGSVSYASLSLDGATGKLLPHEELFKAWTAMAQLLSASPDLGPESRAVCALVTDMVRDAIRRRRMEEEN